MQYVVSYSRAAIMPPPGEEDYMPDTIPCITHDTNPYSWPPFTPTGYPTPSRAAYDRMVTRLQEIVIKRASNGIGTRRPGHLLQLLTITDVSRRMSWKYDELEAAQTDMDWATYELMLAHDGSTEDVERAIERIRSEHEIRLHMAHHDLNEAWAILWSVARDTMPEEK